MKGFAAVFRMEMAEKRNVFIAAAATALLPFILAAFHRTSSPGEVRNFAAYVLLIVFLEIMALMLGITMLGTELSSGRLSFYLSRPINPFALWCGKLVAALTAIVISGIIIVSPVIVSGDFAWPSNDWLEVRNFVAFTIAVLLVAHALSVMKSRSSWFSLDLAGAAIFAALIWFAARSLMTAEDRGVFALALIVGYLVLIAIFIASTVQIIRGRTDRAVSRASFSLTLWSILILVALGCDGYSWWFTHPGINDLGSVQVGSAPARGWVGVSGRALHRDMSLQSAFLLQPESGRVISVGVSLMPPVSSPSGMIVGFRSDGSIWSFDNRSAGASVRDLPIRTGLSPFVSPREFFVGGALSDDGSRLALVEAGTVAVYTLPEAKLIAAINRDALYYLPRLFFRSDNDLEIVDTHREGDETKVELLHLNTTTKQVVRSTLTAAGWIDPIRIFSDGTGERLLTLVHGPLPRQAELIDTTSDKSILKMNSGRYVPPHFVDATRFALVDGTGNATLIRLLDRDGGAVTSFKMALNPKEVASVSQMTPRGNLLIRRSDYMLRNPGDKPVFTVAVVDPATGTVLRTLQNVIPAVNTYWNLDPRALPPSAAEYFIDSTNGSLLQIDPDNGSRRVLVKGELQTPFD